MSRIEQLVALLEDAAELLARPASNDERKALARRIRVFLDTPRARGPFEASLDILADRLTR